MQFTNPHYGQHTQYGGQGSDDSQNFANTREFIKGTKVYRDAIIFPYTNRCFSFALDKLYFVSLSRAPPAQENVHFFTIDQQFVYTNFYADFGPSNMSHVIRFCYFMQEKFDVREEEMCTYLRLIRLSPPESRACKQSAMLIYFL